MKVFILSLLIAIVYSSKAVKSINQERTQYGLPSIKYNYSLSKIINKYKQQGEWLYSPGNMSYNFTYNNITRIQDLNGQFLSFFAKEEFKYLYRDTYRDSVNKIVRMRNNQRVCFNINDCSETFNQYVSCVKNHLQLENSKRCSWANSYYPKHLIGSLTSIAILKLDYQGKFVPESLFNKQHRSFWIYGHYSKEVSDNPLTN